MVSGCNVVKFYRPKRWSAEQIQEEHQFAHDLLNDEVPVAAPIKFNNQTLLTHEGFYYAETDALPEFVQRTSAWGDRT